VNIVGSALIGFGVVLMLLAGVGILRFPDVFTRANAATKAAGLGLGAVLAGVAVHIGTVDAYVKMSIAIALQFATAPVGGHVVARAAYRAGAPLWEGTHIDDLEGWVERPHDPSEYL
jgi:multicomponent Na+:H+ antiporter subunit G